MFDTASIIVLLLLLPLVLGLGEVEIDRRWKIKNFDSARTVSYVRGHFARAEGDNGTYIPGYLSKGT